ARRAALTGRRGTALRGRAALTGTPGAALCGRAALTGTPGAALCACSSQLLRSSPSKFLTALLGPSAELVAGLRRLLVAGVFVPLLRRRITVLGALPMLWVVLPVLAVALRLRALRRDVGVVHVPCVVVVVVDVDVHAAAAPVAVAPEGGADSDACREGEHR